MNNKQTPKSCSCQSCKRAKHSEGGNFMLKKEERSFRHKQNQNLNMGFENISIAQYGNRNG